MRPIDADALKEELCKIYSHLGKRIEISSVYIVQSLFKSIKDAPTIDAVPVVRCKDCKYSEHWYNDRRRCFLWSENGIDVFEDGFCNYAERRDDENR